MISSDPKLHSPDPKYKDPPVRIAPDGDPTPYRRTNGLLLSDSSPSTLMNVGWRHRPLPTSRSHPQSTSAPTFPVRLVSDHIPGSPVSRTPGSLRDRRTTSDLSRSVERVMVHRRSVARNTSKVPTQVSRNLVPLGCLSDGPYPRQDPSTRPGFSTEPFRTGPVSGRRGGPVPCPHGSSRSESPGPGDVVRRPS